MASATTEIYTLSLHDALPISLWRDLGGDVRLPPDQVGIVMAAWDRRVSVPRPPNAVGHGDLERGGDPLMDFGVTVGEAHAALPLVVRAGDIGPALVIHAIHLQITVIEVA